MKISFHKNILRFIILITTFSYATNSNKNSIPAEGPQYELWMTNADKSALFQKQTTLPNVTATGTIPIIDVDESKTFQTMDGFGFALTGGSAQLIHNMNASAQDVLLKELFATDGNKIGISYLRISIGASDLDDHVFSYNDLPVGKTDTAMALFSLNPDRTALIPVLKKIIAINPAIKILGSPWSPPTWMKTNNNSIGGNLKPQYYAAYAKYFVKYIQEMKTEGIVIDAITIQNEALYGGNNPSMVMQANDQAAFTKNQLGPAFAAAKITTKIIIYDHNPDRIDYPLTVLSDTAAKKYIDGSAFHLYGGTITELSKVHDAYPDKNLYFTEQWIGAPGNFSGDLSWHVKNLIIGASSNWCRNVLEWNLASDPNLNPHTPDGCTKCLGAITINGNSVTRNSAYYIIAHASKFVRPGSVRLYSSGPSVLPNVAFKTPNGKRVMIVLNDSQTTQTFTVNSGGKSFTSQLKSGSVGTFVW